MTKAIALLLSALLLSGCYAIFDGPIALGAYIYWVKSEQEYREQALKKAVEER